MNGFHGSHEIIAARFHGKYGALASFKLSCQGMISTDTLLAPPVPAHIHGREINAEQKQYLEGFFAGVARQGFTFAGSAPAVAPVTEEEEPEPLITEERIKHEEHPLDSYYRLAENAVNNRPPDRDEVFRFKWNGLFWLTPVKDTFMARLRIPGGQLKSFQLREIARISRELTTNYIQITTRANLQLRLIEPKDAPEFLARIQSIGLHTRGSGADNIRNLTSNPTAGIDRHELIDSYPLCRELGNFILAHREFYDLPRKFNIAYDGGGLIGTVEDTNDLGAKAVRVVENSAGLEPGVYFRIAAGGATGHKAFARDLGVLVAPGEINKLMLALTRVYIAKGNRGDRKKARLKHLLEKMSLEEYLQEGEKLAGKTFFRAPLDEKGFCALHPDPAPTLPAHSHVGVFPQKQPGKWYIGAEVRVGHISDTQLLRLADLADTYGSGEVRLTVWQNFILPNIPEAYVRTVVKALQKMGFATVPSMTTSGIIACTGSRYCKYAAADTKGHALALGKYLEKRVVLDQPVNIHFTGCANSCAQHYMGDIGLLGTKTSRGEGYHVFIGGGFGKNQAVGRQIFTGLSHEEIPAIVEAMLKGYLRRREGTESFQEFSKRHDMNTLQAIFTNAE